MSLTDDIMNIMDGNIYPYMPKADKVYVNEAKRITVVKWSDGGTTKVTCHKYDEFDVEKAIYIAFMKHMYGESSKFNDDVNKALSNIIYQK